MSTTAGHQNGDEIRRIRKLRQLSVPQLAALIGVHPQSLRKVELNRGGASLGLLVRIAAALKVELSAIVRAPQPVMDQGRGAA